MFKKSKIAVIVLMSLLLNACSTGYNIPKSDKLNNTEEKQKQMIEEWRKVQSPIQFIQTDNNFLITRKNSIPDFIKEIPVDNLNLYKDSTFDDLIGVFSSLGVQLAIKDEQEGENSSSISETNLKIHNYSGDLGNLIELLENTYNLSFNYQTNNIITLEKRTLYIASVPQNKDVIEQISKHLDAMGANDVNVSQTGGFLLYRASRLEQEIIKEYLDSFYKNFASVKLQLAVISVNLNKKDASGFDWSKFSMQLGNLTVLEDLVEETAQNVVNNGTGNGVGTTVPTTPTTPTEEVSYGSNLKDIKSGVAVSSDNAGVVIKNDNFSLKAVYNLLNSYGDTETTQSIYVESTSGSEIELRSGQEIPYTSGINSNVTTGGGSGIVSNGAQTEKIEVGLDIKALPFYDFTKDLVTLEIEMDLKSLIGFVELNAGNGNGTIKQPQTQTQKFNSVLKIRPGEAALVGGISYDVISDTRSNLVFLMDQDTASRNLEITRSSMFLLLRPTVSVFADFESEIKKQQDFKAKQLLEKENQRKIVEERKRKAIELKNKELEEKKKENEKQESLKSTNLNNASNIVRNPIPSNVQQNTNVEKIDVQNSNQQVKKINNGNGVQSQTSTNGTIPSVTKENNNGSN